MLTVREHSVRGGALPASFDAGQWDAFVGTHPAGTAFHRAGWLIATTGALGHQGYALEARDEAGVLRGLLPLVRVASPLFGRYLVAVPFASYGGPLGDAAAVERLTARAIELATRLRVELLELRARQPLNTTPDGLSVSTRKLTVTLPIADGAAATFARFPSKLRSQVRRSEKEGVTVTVGPAQVAAFHAVYAHHMRDLGTPALPRRFFEALARSFGDDFLFAIAALDGVPIACGAGFRYGREFEITWASALRAYSRLSPNMAMYWQLIAHLAECGVHTFNFGRCSPDSGTHRFKQQWGGIDEPLAWYQWSPDGIAATTPAPGGRFSLAQQVWTRLPVPVATTLGPRIARLLP